MKIKLVKLADYLIGTVATVVLPSSSVQPVPALRRILLIRPGGIGDAVLVASLIKSLNKHFPDLDVTILAEQRNKSVFVLIPGVTKVLCYDRPLEFFQALCSSYDVVIDSEQWYRLSAVVTRLIRSAVKIGFDTNERRRMFTHCIAYDLNVYETRNFLALLEPLGIHDQNSTGTLSLPLQAVRKAELLLQQVGSGQIVVLFPGSSIPEKRWGTERFGQVTRRLVRYGYQVVVVGGREEQNFGDEIVNSGGLNVAGMTTLAETAAVIARSRLVISGDSGVLHIAAGLNVRTVSLFGPSSPAKWAPRGDQHIVINKKLPCSPCSTFGMTPTCPNSNKCMTDITVEEVVTAVSQLLAAP